MAEARYNPARAREAHAVPTGACRVDHQHHRVHERAVRHPPRARLLAREVDPRVRGGGDAAFPLVHREPPARRRVEEQVRTAVSLGRPAEHHPDPALFDLHPSADEAARSSVDVVQRHRTADRAPDHAGHFVEHEPALRVRDQARGGRMAEQVVDRLAESDEIEARQPGLLSPMIEECLSNRLVSRAARPRGRADLHIGGSTRSRQMRSTRAAASLTWVQNQRHRARRSVGGASAGRSTTQSLLATKPPPRNR